MTDQSHAPVTSGDLAQFNEAFQQAPTEDAFEEVPDGKYQVTVDRVELVRTREHGTPMLKWALRILGPTFTNRLLWRNNVLATDENVKWLKHDLGVCGLELAQLSDLPDRTQELLDVQLEVTKRTRGEYSNVYFNRRIVTEGGPAAGSGASGAGLGDDIPW